MGAGQSPDLAERWCDAWEREAAFNSRPRSGEFWQDRRHWIDGQIAVRRSPDTGATVGGQFLTRRGYQKANYQAQRAGLFHRLVKNGRLSQVEAEDLIARWEREADISGTKRGSRMYWAIAWDWIEGQRNPPTTEMDAQGDDGQVYGG